MRVALFASGAGSNVQAVLDQVDAGKLAIEVVALVCDQPDAKVVERVVGREIPVFVQSVSTLDGREGWEGAVLDFLAPLEVDYLVLAGFMRLLSPAVLAAYPSRIINIHPSLLPDFPGKTAIKDAYEAKVQKTGVSVFIVDEGIDTGEIIDQVSLTVDPDWSFDELQAHIHEVEHWLYPHVLRNLVIEFESDQLRIEEEAASSHYALLSVSDKTGLDKLARALIDQGVTLLSTGGTYTYLSEAGLAVEAISDYTGSPEILEGRVKTLHPRIHGGILADTSNPIHRSDLYAQDIYPIDYVICNLYPFAQTVAQPGVTQEEAVEQIDIGGVTLLRAAAKNAKRVAVVSDPTDYDWFIHHLETKTLETDERLYLAHKAFQLTAHYDATIARYIRGERQPIVDEQSWPYDTLALEDGHVLRYGENSHQEATVYRVPSSSSFSLLDAKQLSGKALSYNNYRDADRAIRVVAEFSEPAAVALKHMNPCGVAVGRSIQEAFERAYACDSVSIFGGIIALNRPVEAALAQVMSEIFLEVIIAPEFSEEAINILTERKGLRLLVLETDRPFQLGEEYVSINGGLLQQTIDQSTELPREPIDELPELWDVMTNTPPTTTDIKAMNFLMKVAKHVGSNAIVVGTDTQTLGIGAGQMNRVGAAEHALKQAQANLDGEELPLVLASDGFLPMDDTVRLAHEYHVQAVVQPGGSIRDQDSVDYCNRVGMTMVKTNRRHFKH